MIIYRAVVQTIMDYSKREPLKRKEVVIVRCDEKNKDIFVPSSLTNYLYHYHSNNSLNTKLLNGFVIVGFINYLNRQVMLCEDPGFKFLKENGLYALNLYHLAKYINYISNKAEKDNSYDTVKMKEAILINFYYFLYKRGITSKEAKILSKIVPNKGNHKNRRGSLVLISPFENNVNFTIRYPNKERLPSKTLKDMNQDVWELFIEYAEKHYPNIALGVAFQNMGGLRMGEVVNLVVKAVRLFKKERHIKLDIRDRQRELFGDRDINIIKSQVKNPRVNQPVFDFNRRLFEIWDNHIKSLNNNSKVKDRNALFVDSEGQAMSGDTYEQYFYQLKEDFLVFLGQMGHYALEEEFREANWGSHIGRHVFTNHLIKTGAVSDSKGRPIARYLKIMRADESEKSASDYIDEKAIIKTVIDKMELISKISLSI